MNKIYIKSSNFRNLILFLICLNIYMFYNDETTLIVNTFQKTLYSSIIFIILCVNTINIDKIFDLNKYYIIRFEDKKEYINNKIKLISFNNFILFIINIIIYYILHKFSFSFYTLIYLSKIYLLYNIVNIINLLLSLITDKKVYILLSCLILTDILFTPFTDKLTKTLSLHFSSYIRLLNYSSIYKEVSYFIYYFVILLLICMILKYIFIKKENKYENNFRKIIKRNQ